MGSRLVIEHFAVRDWPAGLFVGRRYSTGLGSTPLFQGCVQVGFYCSQPSHSPNPERAETRSCPRRAQFHHARSASKKAPWTHPPPSLLAAVHRIGYGSPMVLDRIHIDPQVCGGKATIRGLRLTVDFVLQLLGDGYTAAEIVKNILNWSLWMSIRRRSIVRLAGEHTPAVS